MPDFSYIAIIFNPNSTGNAKKQAEALHAELRKQRPSVTAELMPTERAGHAIELAYQAAKEHGNPLIISASGDGGYNEVVNGAMRAQNEGAHPVCAVLPSGNANDHARTMQDDSLLQSILKNNVTQLDLLQVDIDAHDGDPISRYAHSYVGLGLTPIVAIELNKHTLNSVREAWIVLRTFWNLRPVVVQSGSRKAKIDSLICSVIPEMAKVITLSNKAAVDDGKFELTTLPHNQKITLAFRLLRGVFRDIGGAKQVEKYGCTVLEATPIQLDGEVMKLTSNTELKITICPKMLRTVI